MKVRWKLIAIALTVGWCIWALFPSVRFYSMSPDERAKLSTEQRMANARSWASTCRVASTSS